MFCKNSNGTIFGSGDRLRLKPPTSPDSHVFYTTYDEPGDVTADNKFRTMGFAYDANGRMVKATRENTPDALSVYDAAGLRVAERVNDVWRFLIYDIRGKMLPNMDLLVSTAVFLMQKRLQNRIGVRAKDFQILRFKYGTMMADKLMRTLLYFTTVLPILVISCNDQISLSNAKTGEEFSNVVNKEMNGVTLKLTHIQSGNARLEFRNGTPQSIFLPYVRPTDDAEMATVFYQFRCKEEGRRQFKDYGMVTHIVPLLNELSSTASFMFEIGDLPKIKARCEVSVLYYVDKNIAELINSRNAFLDKKETEKVRAAQRFAKLEVRLGN